MQRFLRRRSISSETLGVSTCDSDNLREINATKRCCEKYSNKRPKRFSTQNTTCARSNMNCDKNVYGVVANKDFVSDLVMIELYIFQ